MKWKIRYMLLVPLLFCFFPLILFGKNKDVKHPAAHPSAKAWELMVPYLLPKDHPVKQTLDSLFSKTRVLQDRNSLIKAGFVGVNSRPDYKVIVARHPKMPGYVFKLYTDDRLTYSQGGRPEYLLWARRAKGAEMVRQEIAKQGWQDYFKAPIKWVYPLPASAPKAKSNHLQKNFILVEEDMGILTRDEAKVRWKDGSITPQHLHMLFHLLSTLGMYDSGAPCNIPLCKDGRIAFIDTLSMGRWPPNYHRLLPFLNNEMASVWKKLVREDKKLGLSQNQRRELLEE